MLTLTIVNAEGKVLEGATVAYTVNSVPCSCVSDVNGQISIDGLPTGNYTFVVSLSGYVDNTITLAVGSENVTGSVTLTAEVVTATKEAATAINSDAVASSIILNSAITTTSQVIDSVVTTVASDSHTGIANKIASLAAEIGTTKSLYVKIRNTVEIGVLSALLSKVASTISDKVK